MRAQTGREVRRLDVEGLDAAALIPALGLRPGVDPFVLLEGAGWGGFVLAFEPEREIKVADETPFSSPFEALRRELAGPADTPHPLSGGPALFGYVSYDAARHLEKLPALSTADLALPQARFLTPRYTIGADGDGAWVSVPAGESPEPLARLVRGVAGERPRAGEPGGPGGSGGNPRSSLGREGYLEAVERVKEYVRAGDVFQVNISQRLDLPFSGDPLALYTTLRRTNPSPFGGIVSFPDMVAVSSSPERLVDLRGGRASTRPIAGTYPREQVEREGREAFLVDPKERAEHAMIVDLERNDLGRSSAYGTVRVDELMSTETYSHVVHLVSEISGRLAPGHDAVSLLSGMFPGGTITGCPKVRCMEIIEEIEPVRRALYTGSFGYLSPGGGFMDMNIAIRTILLTGGRAHVQAGGGIVADSVPEREYQESLNKASALVGSLGSSVEPLR
ncbi:anthranilate synthase component I family protein [Rubrobacter aplysinae]|uniref:anthranilate synthase component I family protein n=1 Tax=Rubrobacter aplysinae TaxID=909625 RepID=UPI001F42BBCE|nr:anthranilate synthase component I family protein [Rubrobacter aplysinae]